MRDKNNHIDDQLRESVGEFEQSPPDMLWASINPTNNGVTVKFKPYAGIFKWAAVFLLAAGLYYTLYHFYSEDHGKQTIASDGPTENLGTGPRSIKSKDLIHSKDQVVSDDNPMYAGQDNLPPTEDNFASPNSNHKTAKDFDMDNAVGMPINKNTPDEPFTYDSKENSTNEGFPVLDRSLLQIPKFKNLVSKRITSFPISADNKTITSSPTINQNIIEHIPVKLNNKQFYVQFNLQKLALEKVDYKTNPKNNKSTQLEYKFDYQDQIIYNKVLLVGAKFCNGLIVESGATHGKYYFTNLYNGELYAKDKEEIMGNHNYNISMETTNGTVNAKIKLSPDSSSTDTKDKFGTSIYMKQELESWGLPILVGYAKTRNKWDLIAKVGFDLTFFKQRDLSFAVEGFDNDTYRPSNAVIDIENVVSSNYKITFAIQGQLGVEYRPTPRLGLQTTIGSTKELNKPTIGTPNRRWNQCSIGLKWYL
jgi:hypothetical protein